MYIKKDAEALDVRSASLASMSSQDGCQQKKDLTTIEKKECRASCFGTPRIRHEGVAQGAVSEKTDASRLILTGKIVDIETCTWIEKFQKEFQRKSSMASWTESKAVPSARTIVKGLRVGEPALDPGEEPAGLG